MELEREQLRKDQVPVLPGTVAVLELFSPAPLEVPLPLQKSLVRRILEKQVTAGSFIVFKHIENVALDLHSLWITQDR